MQDIKPDESRQIIDLIRNLEKGIRRHGIKKIVRALRQVEIEGKGVFHSEIVEYIVAETCSLMGVVREKLYDFKTRGDTTVARKICILLLRKHLDLSDVETAGHFNRSRQITHNTEVEFSKLDAKNKFDKQFLDTYNEVDAKVKIFLEKLNS